MEIKEKRSASVLSATAKMLEHLQAGTRLTPWKVPSQLVRMGDGERGEKIYQYVKDVSCYALIALHLFLTFFHNELIICVIYFGNRIFLYTNLLPKMSIWRLREISVWCPKDVSVTGFNINWARVQSLTWYSIKCRDTND